MTDRRHGALAIVALIAVGTGLQAQTSAPPSPPLTFKGADNAPAPTPPPANAIAATVNGQAIPEMAVFRALMKENPKNYEQARKEVIQYLADNILIDQYLGYIKVEVPAKAIDDKIEQIKADAEKSKSTLEAVLKALYLTEPELRKEMGCVLRWDRFVADQSTEAKVKDFFGKNKNMFDGTQMQARHILIKATAGVPASQNVAHVMELKKRIEEQTTQELAKLPADQRESHRATVLEKVFADTAAKESDCPSKKDGGSLGWFPRTGKLVEPFARATFQLKPYQMSDVVTTEFGQHLILAIEVKPGRDVNYDDVKAFVREIYAERLREAVIATMRPRSKIEINPLAK